MGISAAVVILLIRIISIIGRVITFAFIVRAIISWVPLNNTEGVRKFKDILYKITEPLLAPIRKLLNKHYAGAFDFSPIIAIVLVNLIVRILIKILVVITFGTWAALLGGMNGFVG